VFTRILHPTDFSECAQSALQMAVYLAVSHRAELRIFHARVLHAEDPAREDASLARAVADARFHARAWLDHDADGRLDVTAEEARGVDAYAALSEEIDSTGPDLIVMGTHGRTGLDRLLMGSLTDKILRHAPCHVMTVRSDARLPAPGRGVERLLVPVDFSEPSKRALDAARSFSERTGARATVVHVMSTVVPAHYAASVDSSFELDPQLLSAAERTLRAWTTGRDVDLALAQGLASIEIPRLAAERDVDLIVMGTRGLTGLEHVLVGSVTERVCRTARVPVMVVK